jgi:hypothetical protein
VYVSVCNLPKRVLFPSPNRVDASYFISSNCIGERPGADTKDVATLIDEMAGCLDRGFWGRSPFDMVRSALPILDMPSHTRPY